MQSGWGCGQGPRKGSLDWDASGLWLLRKAVLKNTRCRTHSEQGQGPGEQVRRDSSRLGRDEAPNLAPAMRLPLCEAHVSETRSSPHPGLGLLGKSQLLGMTVCVPAGLAFGMEEMVPPCDQCWIWLGLI